MGTILWALTFFGGLIAVPIAFKQRKTNQLRFKLISITATLYLLIQFILYWWIFEILRYENRDWLHALFLPYFLGLGLPVLMCILWFSTRHLNKP
jgi:hypothetical protein